MNSRLQFWLSTGKECKAWLALWLALLCLFAPLQAHAMSEEQKITLLIQSVKEAPEGTRFIRNGSVYSVDDAVAHLNMKYSKAKSRIKTAEDFIKYVASTSSMSGEAYLVRYPDGNSVTAATFFTEKLRGLNEQKGVKIDQIKWPYELYSWQQPVVDPDYSAKPSDSGTWSFSIVVMKSGAMTRVEEVFDIKNRLTGIQALQEKLASLPKGTHIHWLGTSEVKGKESEMLTSPPPGLIEMIVAFGYAHDLKIDPPWEYKQQIKKNNSSGNKQN